jgi:hypothetical protein
MMDSMYCDAAELSEPTVVDQGLDVHESGAFARTRAPHTR